MKLCVITQGGALLPAGRTAARAAGGDYISFSGEGGSHLDGNPGFMTYKANLITTDEEALDTLSQQTDGQNYIKLR